ncbi:acyltransferase [Sphingobium yanoikuyae]|uniref:acyltransferase n=1 Tax=Sphingobium yanoikuyae TaxID=13690 RepID=UPI0026EF295D|nr:hypothetical protein [Sphingobium yanoikuyae]
MSSNFAVEPGNDVDIGQHNNVTGAVIGKGNRIRIAPTIYRPHIDLRVRGNNNNIVIGANNAAKSLTIFVGNHFPANDVNLTIGDDFSCEPDCKFFVFNSNNVVTIGNDCMFSNSIILRAGESPHLIFDAETGDYIDVSEGIFIGDHVWVGERAYITKRVTIPNESIVAACAVVTKRFDEEHCVIGGNPGKIVRSGVKWVRNHSKFVEGDKYQQGYDRHHG